MLTLLLLACPAPSVPAGDSKPAVAIAWPNPDLGSEDQTVCPVFTVVLDLQNFKMDPDHYGAEPIDGEGHWHLWLDNTAMDSAPAAAPRVPFGTPNKDADGDGLFEGITEDVHVLNAKLVQNDHTDLPADQQGEHVAQLEINVVNEPGCQGSFGADDQDVDTGGDSADSGT